jgi:hypothetical protein
VKIARQACVVCHVNAPFSAENNAHLCEEHDLEVVVHCVYSLGRTNTAFSLLIALLRNAEPLQMSTDSHQTIRCTARGAVRL